MEIIGIPEKIELLRSIEKKIRTYDPRIVTLDYCIIGQFTTECSLMNSKALSLSQKENGLIIFLSVVVKDGNEMKTASYRKMTRDFASLHADDIVKAVAEEGTC